MLDKEKTLFKYQQSGNTCKHQHYLKVDYQYINLNTMIK